MGKSHYGLTGASSRNQQPMPMLGIPDGSRLGSWPQNSEALKYSTLGHYSSVFEQKHLFESMQRNSGGSVFDWDDTEK